MAQGMIPEFCNRLLRHLKQDRFNHALRFIGVVCTIAHSPLARQYHRLTHHCNMCFGTGVTRFCCPCYKSNLKNCRGVAGGSFGFYATWICLAIYDFQRNNTSILFNVRSHSRFLAPLIAISVIGLIASFLLLYGMKRKIKWILVLWIVITQLTTVVWTVGLSGIPESNMSNLALALWLLYVWSHNIFGSLIVYSGIQEIENDSPQNVAETQLQNV